MNTIKFLFYQHIESLGGAEIYLLRLLPELKKKGIEVDFYCTQTAGNKEIVDLFSSKLAADNITVIVCKSSSPFSIKNLKALSKTAKTGKYNVLSIHLIHAELATVLSKILFGIKSKIIITKHGYQQAFHAKYGLDFSHINKMSSRYLTEKFIQNFVKGNIAISNGIAEFYIQTGIVKKNNICVIHHGIDLDYCANTVPVRLHKNQVIIVGRLIKFKGHHLLLKAIAELKETYQDFKLVIAGDGEEKNNLKKMADEYSINNWVEFTGHTNRVKEYVAGSDIVMVPSIAEPFGLVILEAYCSKKPVIAFNVPAINEIVVNNETGFLIEPFDTRDMANKILFLLTNPSKRIEYGERGYRYIAQNFTFDNTINKTVGYYESIISNN